MTTRKTFDCVEMKHQAAQKVQAHMATMTIAERLAYLRQIASEFRQDGTIPHLPRKRHDSMSTGTDA